MFIVSSEKLIACLISARASSCFPRSQGEPVNFQAGDSALTRGDRNNENKTHPNNRDGARRAHNVDDAEHPAEGTEGTSAGPSKRFLRTSAHVDHRAKARCE